MPLGGPLIRLLSAMACMGQVSMWQVIMAELGILYGLRITAYCLTCIGHFFGE